ncbi:MAG: CotH kinase family protein, partial [Verrucomicrobiales bacterium]
MVGRASRSLDRFKHNLRVVFRGEYGDRRLNFPLMKGAGSEVERFNSLILRGGNGDSWINPGVIHRAQYIRDQWHRDMQRATGQPNQPQIYAHLYINGLYWGFYHVFDRMEDDFVAEHFGGQEEDYDVVKDAGTNSIMEVVDGDLDAWNALLAASAQDLSQPANYEAIQEYLNLDWFIDYLLINFYSGNNDWDQSNWRAARRREPGAPWMLFSWDSERTDLNATGVANGALTGPNDRDVTTKNNLNFPTSIHQRLTAGSAEYRLRFADRTRKHFFNGGVLTPAGAAALYNARATEIYDALIAEACRWGDRHSEPPMTREFRWQEMLDMMNDDFFPFRTDIVLAQLRARGLYPAIDAPDFAQHGGNVATGFPLTMGAAGGGTIYYTLDGSDPREEGTGAILGSEYTGPLALQATGTVKARAF